MPVRSGVHTGPVDAATDLSPAPPPADPAAPPPADPPVPALDPAVAALLKRDAAGLVCAVVVEDITAEVLMVAWMDDAALALTLTTGRAWYFSRSRGALWRKGDTSGHVQHVVSAALDCDGDALVVRVRQEGPACHTGARSCFDVHPLTTARDGEGPPSATASPATASPEASAFGEPAPGSPA